MCLVAVVSGNRTACKNLWTNPWSYWLSGQPCSGRSPGRIQTSRPLSAPEGSRGRHFWFLVQDMRMVHLVQARGGGGATFLLDMFMIKTRHCLWISRPGLWRVFKKSRKSLDTWSASKLEWRLMDGLMVLPSWVSGTEEAQTFHECQTF